VTVEYSSDRLVRTVGSCGRIRWNGERIFITKALGNQPIGLEGVADGLWRLWYSFHPIGWLDERTMKVQELADRIPPASTASMDGSTESLRQQGA
jgi:hypothetical protein